MKRSILTVMLFIASFVIAFYILLIGIVQFFIMNSASLGIFLGCGLILVLIMLGWLWAMLKNKSHLIHFLGDMVAYAMAMGLVVIAVGIVLIVIKKS